MLYVNRKIIEKYAIVNQVSLVMHKLSVAQLNSVQQILVVLEPHAKIVKVPSNVHVHLDLSAIRTTKAVVRPLNA